MARARRNGVLIAGGGLSGCLAALALARRRPEIPLLIVEENARFGGEDFHFWFDSELEGEEGTLLGPLAERSWPGFYLAFPGMTRNLRAPLASFPAQALHRAMVETLKPDQYRLGTRVVAVREDALELDGGETVKAEGAIDARGATNLSMLDLLYETRVDRVVRTERPHRLDRPLLVDANVDQGLGFAFVRAFPLDDLRLRIASVLVSERGQPDETADSRLDHYLDGRGWTPEATEAHIRASRVLPIGGDFDAFWRLGGARVARLGLRGGLIQPATGRSAVDAARAAMLLAGQPDFSGTALHGQLENHAKQLWRGREFARGINASLAAARPEARRAIMARLYRLEAGLLLRFQSGRLGLLERARVQRRLQA